MTEQRILRQARASPPPLAPFSRALAAPRTMPALRGAVNPLAAVGTWQPSTFHLGEAAEELRIALAILHTLQSISPLLRPDADFQRTMTAKLLSPEPGAHTFAARTAEHLDHTADILVHAWGRDFGQALAHAALSMNEYMVGDMRAVTVRAARPLRAVGVARSKM